ncbi:MAG: hypothetical protein D6707_06175 [Bacteroidetes bacterium]|nr:MAG: hypothetical protein D6707_06175 [Bacteroidota bacterium]
MLFTVFIALFVWFALRSMESEKILFPVLAGLFLGMATLTGPILLGVFPLIALWILFIWRTNLLKKFYFTAVLLLTAIFTLIPWSIRNYKIFGKITPVSASVDWFLAEAESRVQRQIMVKIRSDAEGQHFDVYVNGKYDGTLSDTTSAQLVDKDYYFALMLKGGLSKYIDRCEFMFKNSDSPDDKRIIDEFEDESFTKNWLADSVFKIIDGQLTTTSPDVNRNYLAIFKAMASPQTVILHWGKDTEAAGVSQTGLVFLIGRPSFQENGYMIRREPYGLLQLWRVQNGKPVQLLDSKQGLKGLASATDGRIKERSLFGKIFHILTDDPQNFFEHYFSEFLHFWQLYPDRVMTKNKFTNKKNVVVSILSFGPVLLLSILGIILSFSNWRYTSLLFIMIIAFALGYSFFQTRIRYRIPVEPYMIIFASYSIWLLFEKFKRIRS